MASKAPLVFLCHSHRDKAFARKLATHLSELAVDVWFDEWELTPGDSLHECVGEALRKSAFIAVLLTPDSVKSKWCKSELQNGLAVENRRGRKIVLPLLCKRVSLPPFLEDRLYANFNVSYYNALAQLVALVHDIDPKFVAKELARSAPRSAGAVRQLLARSGWDSLKYMPAEDYKAVQRILKRSGVELPTDEFVIIPAPISRFSRPRPLKVKK